MGTTSNWKPRSSPTCIYVVRFPSAQYRESPTPMPGTDTSVRIGLSLAINSMQWQSTGGSPRARVMAGMSLFRASTCQHRQPSFCSFVSISDQSVVAAFACVCRHDADRFSERVWASALSLGTSCARLSFKFRSRVPMHTHQLIDIISHDDHLPSFFPTPCLPTGFCASSYRQRCIHVK
ncbi:hypothetical protein H4582DRAFT_1216087 [Lactarius indigo]|nr:hypothetical protein H4582DRAFT_1216087 [Lactarius indigo]